MTLDATLPVELASLGEYELSHLDALARAFTRGELQHGVRLPSRGHAPRAQSLDDVDDAHASIQEERIDREAHESGVNPGRRRDEHSLTGRQPLAAEQPAHAQQRAVCQLAYADRAVPREIDDQLGLGHYRQ